MELFAWVGLSSYSLYLTHSLVIMQGWRLGSINWPPLVSAFVIVIPATVTFAWIFYQFCERPFISQSSATKIATREAQATKPVAERPEPQQPIFAQSLVPLTED